MTNGPRRNSPRQATPSPADKPDVRPDDAPVFPVVPEVTPEPEPAEVKTTETPETPSVTEETANPQTPTVVAPKARKAPTRAQVARDDAAKVRAAQDKAVLEGAPTFVVAYPTGTSLYLPDDDEIEVTMSGGEKVWIDVINGFAHIPAEGRVRATTVTQLTDFTRLAGQAVLKQVAAS